MEKEKEVSLVPQDQQVATLKEGMPRSSEDLLPVEEYLHQNYEFRYNVLSGKMEVRSRRAVATAGDSAVPFVHLDKKVSNGIFLSVMRDLPDETNVKTIMEATIYGPMTPDFNPVQEWLKSLPAWDGRNRISYLCNLIPGMTAEQAYWFTIWLRSAVAHWQQRDMLHGNECVPTLIGEQGCGKSTFCQRLLPPHLREYYLDHVNLRNKFDKEMALTNCLLVNIDEIDQITTRQQPELKQMLSKSRVNGRMIYGKEQTDRQRYASFIATTNNPHPLRDRTGSRRFICIEVPKGQIINNDEELDYEQLYAQVLDELERGERYWFTTEETISIQRANTPYQNSMDLEVMLEACFCQPESKEYVHPMSLQEIAEIMSHQYPGITINQGLKVQLGRLLTRLGYRRHEHNFGQVYEIARKMAS